MYGVNMSWENQVPEKITQLLLEFDTLFQEPKQLLLYRSHDHSIVLKDGSSSVNLRPYRHSSFQKDVVEKMVEDLLAGGLIKHSSSGFASPVILVKKKNGTW